MKAWNLARAVARFVADGCRTVTQQQYRQRLETCQGCEYRKGGKCLECSCWVQLKARLWTEDCPAGKWTPNPGCIRESREPD